MMRMKDKPTGLSPINSSAAATGGESGSEWEIRPGGMLVQKRNPDLDRTSAPAPRIRVRVKYGSIYHEISINSQATFGELKKILTGPTGLPHQDQKLIYKDKERDSKAFLDIAGVKDRSKIVLVEDPMSQERRYLELRKNAKTEKASKSISEISLEVDRLAGQVSSLESIITKTGKVEEKDVLTLIELLMNQLLKLDGIMADGDAKLQRKMQVRRVQKYVETLDLLKIKNSTPNSIGGQIQTQNRRKYSNGQRLAPIQEDPLRHSNGQRPTTAQEEEQQQLQQPGHSFGHVRIQQQEDHHQKQHQQRQQFRHSTSGPAVVTTNWETFDSTPASVPASTSTSTSSSNNSVQPKFNWEFFD